VGLPVLPSLLWEVRTKRILGAIVNVVVRLYVIVFGEGVDWQIDNLSMKEGYQLQERRRGIYCVHHGGAG
jgi:hypothetical protein